MLKFKTDQYGFTLLEAVITITIITVGIFSIVKIFPISFKISKSSEQTTVATNLAQAKLEEIFSLGYENIPLGTIEAKHRLATDINNPFYYYQRQTDTAYVDTNLNPTATDTGIKKITTTVFWQNPLLASEKNVSLVILISKR